MQLLFYRWHKYSSDGWNASFSHEWHNSITNLGWPYKVETNPRREEQIDGSRPVWVVNQPIILSHHRGKLFRHMSRKCIEIIMDAKNNHNLDIAVLDVPQISRKYFHITHSGENMLAANWQIGIIHFPRSTFMGESLLRWFFWGCWQRRSLIVGCHLFCRAAQSIRLWDWGKLGRG